MNVARYAAALLVFTSALLYSVPALAFFHLWDLGEFFSSPDGNVQFIEMQTDPFASGEIFAEGATITSQSTGKTFTFHGQLSGNTANKTLLIASPGFSSLPGAVAPDYVFDTANFFNAAGDTIRFFASGFNYDTRAFTSVPTDGIQSRTYFPNETLAVNSPKNYAGVAGSVNLSLPSPTGDYNGNHVVDAADYVLWRNTLTQSVSPNGSGADGSGNGTIDSADYDFWKARFGNAVPAAGSGIGATAVPEPMTPTLIVASLTLFALGRRRR